MKCVLDSFCPVLLGKVRANPKDPNSTPLLNLLKRGVWGVIGFSVYRSEIESDLSAQWYQPRSGASGLLAHNFEPPTFLGVLK